MAAQKRRPRFLHWPSWLILWVGLILIRWQLLEELNLDFSSALEAGFVLGIHSDFMAAMLPLVLSWLLWGMIALPRKVGFFLGASLIWVITWANVVYFRQFGISMDWWVLELHSGDLFEVSGTVFQLGWNGFLGSSFFLFLISCLVYIHREGRFSDRLSNYRGILADKTPFLKLRLRGMVIGTGLVFLFFLLQQSPRAFVTISIGQPVNSHILQLWYYQKLKESPFSGLKREKLDKFVSDIQNPQENPGQILAQYRDFREADWLPDDAAGSGPVAKKRPGMELVSTGAGSGEIQKRETLLNVSDDGNISPAEVTQLPKKKPAPAGSDKWPLLRDFQPSAEETRDLRKRLGLPEKGPIHIILLLAESLRAYEMIHPEIGPLVFPRMKSILSRHGVTFFNGYSSSYSAGATARGTFSTICSFIPNIPGPATYIAYSTIKIRCLPSLLKENGYKTLWFNSHRANNHNTYFFESRHGMDHFHDREYFREKGVRETVGEWGLGDGPFLKVTLEKILEYASAGSDPLYAQIATMSTHTPAVAVPGIRFNDEFEELMSGNKIYRDYLSMWRYADDALGDFIEGLFASAIGENSVVFFLGDHGNGEKTHLPQSAIQRFDARFRMPIAVITKNMPKAHIKERVVSQIDVAPTAARIAGVRGKVTWLGKGLFSPAGEGSPWVFSSFGKIYWRTKSMACYNRECFDLKNGGDPSTDNLSNPIPPQPELDRFFKMVVKNIGIAIGGNLISPIN